ncbi:MAG: phosphate signaling complex protein PhoU [Pseudomonadota bacterium]
MEETLHIDSHTSRQFNRELEELRARVMTMGGLVEQQCKDAVTALIEGNAELAAKVADGDAAVNALEVQINAECMEILARRQPAAGDLRLILSVIRVISDLERIGDEAEKVGRMSLDLASRPEIKAHRAEPKHLGKNVVTMLGGALDAFARSDVAAAIKVAARDPENDDEFESLTRLLFTHIMAEPQEVRYLLQVNWCARALERIGDHIVNLCEEVIFLVKGSDVRHLSLEEIVARFG